MTLSRKILTLLLLTSSLAMARPPEEAEFQAAGTLGQEIAEWIISRDPRPTSLAIYNVHANYPFDPDFGTIVETEIVKYLAKNDLNRVSSCAECRSAQVAVHEDRVVVTRGAPDIETIKRLGSKIPVETLLVVELYRTKIAVVAQAVLYQNQTGLLLGADRFRASALNFTDASVQVLLTLGGGKSVSALATATTSGISLAGSLSLLEELGFGKGGLNIGGVFGGETTLFYLNPTLSFRGRFGVGSMSYSVNLGAGFGFTPAAKGVSLKASYEIFIGSLTCVGLEGLYFIPDHSGVRTLTAYGGVHIGLAFGR